MCGVCGCDKSSTQKQEVNPEFIQIEQDILAENQQYANQNRRNFLSKNISAYNLVSSPGSGKTTLLVETINRLKKNFPVCVIEGDQQTDLDAKRIATTKVPVVQVNTGKTCHLDAHHISHAVEELPLQKNSFLFIENVGNLVCPALFDLGELAKVVILSVTEGEDKPLKYPHMFDQATLMVINKIDLLPYVRFDLDQAIKYAKQINPTIEAISLSAITGEGVSDWYNYLTQQMSTLSQDETTCHSNSRTDSGSGI